jgi:hypothetical protein
MANKRPINNPKNNDADNNFIVIAVALSNFGKLLIINSKSINMPYCISLLIYLLASYLNMLATNIKLLQRNKKIKDL